MKALSNLVRLGVATCLWYFCTSFFVHFERRTGQCHGFEALSRHHCSDKGGKWIPGFDISGHCFLLIYSVLIMCEEAVAFKNWPTSPKTTPQHIPSAREYVEFHVASGHVQYLFIAMAVFHFLWDVQLVITTLYYHTLSHKFLGALIGIICWFSTYHIWPVYFPMKVNRKLKVGSVEARMKTVGGRQIIMRRVLQEKPFLGWGHDPREPVTKLSYPL
uniref:Uncharacterized protein n=1 Tax=Acrobeloides nanus TaxID=290746 RepID=A0A914BXD4_9BILA